MGAGLTSKFNWIHFDTAHCVPTCLLPTLTLKVWSLDAASVAWENLLKTHILRPHPIIKSEVLEVGPWKL